MILVLCGILMLSAGMAWGQAFPPNEAGVTMGHWHLNTRNIEASRKIFLAMGGTVGSVVNHVGFIVPIVQESVARWKAAGVPVLPGGNGRADQAFVVTPDELRIEILEDKNQKFPIRHHHVHFGVPESAIPQIQDDILIPNVPPGTYRLEETQAAAALRTQQVREAHGFPDMRISKSGKLTVSLTCESASPGS